MVEIAEAYLQATLIEIQQREKVMGMITITTAGSFGNKSRTFEAQHHGHADAVATAIEYLSSELLPEATAQDHELHKEGSFPLGGFRRDND